MGKTLKNQAYDCPPRYLWGRNFSYLRECTSGTWVSFSILPIMINVRLEQEGPALG